MRSLLPAMEAALETWPKPPSRRYAGRPWLDEANDLIAFAALFGPSLRLTLAEAPLGKPDDERHAAARVLAPRAGVRRTMWTASTPNRTACTCCTSRPARRRPGASMLEGLARGLERRVRAAERRSAPSYRRNSARPTSRGGTDGARRGARTPSPSTSNVCQTRGLATSPGSCRTVTGRGRQTTGAGGSKCTTNPDATWPRRSVKW